MSLFSLHDFDAWVNRNLTIRVSLQDQNNLWIQPPFTEAFFAIAPRASSSNFQGQIPKIFERDTTGVYVRFIQIASGQWYLDCDLLPTDTAALMPGIYYYETSLQITSGIFTLRTGLFRLHPTIT